MKKQKAHKISGLKFQNFIFLTIAGIVNAIGVTLFLQPCGLIDSGISGTALVLSCEAVQSTLPLSFFLVVLNLPLFLYGLKRQGISFTVYAIYVVVIYSLAAYVINKLLPIDIQSFTYLQRDGAGNTIHIIICALFGGIISGIGSGLAIRFGGAMDGIEVMAVIFAKRIGITVGTFVMIYNVIIYIIYGIVTSDFVLPLYSIITYFAGLKTIDYIVEGLSRSKSAIIVTNMPEEICSALSKTFECGTTVMSAKGGYSNEPKYLIYFVVNRFQVAKMKDIVYSIDRKAYISISEVADIFRAAPSDNISSPGNTNNDAANESNQEYASDICKEETEETEETDKQESTLPCEK